MKKIFVALVCTLLFAGAALAQPRAIGGRLGGDNEFSYQHYLGTNFLEADLGFSTFGKNAGFRATAIYDFPFQLAESFILYAGPGAQLGSYNTENGAAFCMGVGGQVGLEYQFGFPLNLTIDWRPMWNFVGNFIAYTSFSVGARYRF